MLGRTAMSATSEHRRGQHTEKNRTSLGNLYAANTQASAVMKSIVHGGQLGQRCRHDTFGEGTITELDSDYYTIEFDDHGQKKISKDFVTLG
jgi:hypothetical protein